MEKKKALEEAQSIFKSTGYNIKSKGLNEFITILKERIEDSNLQVSTQAYFVTKDLAKSLKSDFRQFSKSLTTLILGYLAAKNMATRLDCRAFLKELSGYIGEDRVVRNMIVKMQLPNIELKTACIKDRKK